jgi:SAM-dependent methyltransferase
MWSAVAGNWSDQAEFVDARSSELTETLLDLAGVTEGRRVLELACGPGGVGLAAAERVGSTGEVVLSDVAPEMTSIAGSRAAALGLRNVRTAVLDLEEIAEPDESFDAVVCREGLMFAADPAQAAGEIQRVLRPGGSVALAVWGPRARNPWVGLVLDVLSAQVGQPVPPPGIPGPFALEDAERLGGILREAGFADVEVREQEVPNSAGSFEEWWSRTVALAGPVAALVANLPPPATAELEQRARAATAPYANDDGGLEFPGVTLVAAGHRPA